MKRMMTWRLMAAAMFVLGGFVNAGDLPEAAPPVWSAAPAMDGKPDDPCWQNAAALGDFYLYKDPAGGRSRDTRALVARDGKFLYIAVECRNPNMRFLDLHGVTEDDATICHDDSIEIFVQRAGMDRYYHYMLNYAGIKGERRIVKNKDGNLLRDLAWNFPWIAAAQTGETGWTAEIAIPLAVLNAEAPGAVRLNLMRNLVKIELDAYGAKISESRSHYFWAPVKNSAHETESFGVLAGLESENQAAYPLLVMLDQVQTGELKTEGGQFSFDVQGEILGATPAAGEAEIEVVESDAGAGERVLAAATLVLPPRCQQQFAINVPVPDFSEKTLRLRVTDRQTGMVLAGKRIPFSGNIIREIYSEFSFYSSEKTLRIRVILDMTRETLASMTLALKDTDGKSIAETKAPLPETVLTLEAGILQPGGNHFKAVLVNAEGKSLGERKLSVTRLPGQPNESKSDQFRRVLMFQGRPYFAFGMYCGAQFDSNPVVMDAYIKALSSAKMNTIITFNGAFEGKFSQDALQQACRALHAAGINVIIWGGLHKASSAWESKAAGLKNIVQEEKNRHAREYYETELLPNIRNCAATLKDQENFLAWYGMDEPNLGDWVSRLYVQGLFRTTIAELDPHHAMFGLYARTIPPVPEALETFDYLAYDIYTYPNWNNEHSRPCDPMAAQVAQLDRRAATRRMPIWVVPQPAALDPGRCPLPLSGDELMCQAYAAMIYGAKGIVYFTYMLANSDETWAALRRLGSQVETLAPALLNDPAQQQVKYASGNYDAAHWKIPPVPFRLFRFPDGRLLGMAVNSRNYPVELNLKIKNLSGAQRMFGDQSAFRIAGESFTDKLEPYGVRAYELAAPLDAAAPAEVSIAATPHPELAAPAPQIEAIKERRNNSRNLVFNPSFEDRRKLTDRPDFYMPYRVLRHHTMDGARDYALDTENPKFGKVSLRIGQPAGYGWGGVYGLAAVPKDRGQPYVFSFYARAAEDKTRLWVGLPNEGKGLWQDKNFELSREWARYSMPCASPGGAFLMQLAEKSKLDQPYTVWLDGIQLEKGETPGEFTEK